MGEMAEFYMNVENGGCDQCGELDCICDCSCFTEGWEQCEVCNGSIEDENN